MVPLGVIHCRPSISAALMREAEKVERLLGLYCSTPLHVSHMHVCFGRYEGALRAGQHHIWCH
jgi:hypothetical protein